MSDAAKLRKKYGKAVRISLDVKNYLEKRQRGTESYDSILRRLFGLPTRKGDTQPLGLLFVIPNGEAPITKLTLAEARGQAILRAARRGSKKAEAVLTYQEVP